MTRFRLDWNLSGVKVLRSRRAAEIQQAKMEARLKEANKVCDGEIWTSIDEIYETRWDCPTVRLAAAM